MCPFCDTWDVSLRQERLRRDGTDQRALLTVPMESLGRHLGRHMEQLALFAVPPGSYDEMDDDTSIHSDRNLGPGEQEHGSLSSLFDDDSSIANTVISRPVSSQSDSLSVDEGESLQQPRRLSRISEERDHRWRYGPSEDAESSDHRSQAQYRPSGIDMVQQPISGRGSLLPARQ